MYIDFTDSKTTVSGKTAIDNAITNILMTRKGSVPGKPEFGSELYRMIFKPIDHITVSVLKNYIKESLSKFEPRIYIRVINIIEIPEYNRINIEIEYEYTLVGLTSVEKTNITFNK